MWRFEQLNGRISDNNNVTLAMTYSGHPPHVNDPTAENIPFEGPIPRGLYTITVIEDSPNTGPNTLILIPDPGNEMFGRDNFRIHGDDIHKPGQHCASDGCIIAGPGPRMTMWNSPDHLLQVVDTLKTEQDLWP